MTEEGAFAVKSRRKEGLTFIEQLHALSVQLCPNPKVPYITGIDKGTVYLMRGSCGMWSCEVCGSRNARKWLARMLEHMNQSKNPRWYFLTITAHEKWRGSQASRKNLQQGWKKLYNRMRRKYGISEYVKVWEFHHDSKIDATWHLHILINRKIGKRWLKDNSRQCGMGYMVDSSKSKNAGQVAGYVAKYLVKSFAFSNNYIKGMRRIEASRNWTKLQDLSQEMEKYIIHQTRNGQDNTALKYKGDGMEIKDIRPSRTREAQLINMD